MLKIDTSTIPSVNALRGRFRFIADPTLQTNVCIAFQYIIFQISILQGKDSLPGPILYSLYKSVILYTASIVEATTHFCLFKMIENGTLKEHEIMPFEWISENSIITYSISDTERVFGIKQKKSQEKLKKSSQFHILNKAVEKAGLFDSEIFRKADWLRQKRNRIHLTGLANEEEVYPNEKDIEKAFSFAKDILSILETNC